MSETASNANEQQTSVVSQPAEKPTRKPYIPPQLTKHGGVTELTRGGGSVIDDGLGTFEAGV